MSIRIKILLSISVFSLSAEAALLYDSGTPQVGAGLGIFEDQWLAQRVTATDDWQVGRLGIFASGTQDLTVLLLEDVAGKPGGQFIQQWTFSGINWSPEGSWAYVSGEARMARGTQYWLAFTSASSMFEPGFLPAPAPVGYTTLAVSEDKGASWYLVPDVGPVGVRIEAVPEPAAFHLMIAGLTILILRSQWRHVDARSAPVDNAAPTFRNGIAT